MASPAISAIICTRNRARHLRNALASLVHQSLSRDRYEIVVVDNGSDDETSQVVHAFANDGPVRYVHEPSVGLSRARNRGWQAARAAYVAYLDDDAVATEIWLETALTAFASILPTPGCVGGRVLPRWEAPPPRWLTEKLEHYLSVVDWADTSRAVREREWLLGANTCYPRQLLRSIGGFREDLGRVGDRLSSMEELDVQKQIEARGLPAFYVPDMTVHHHIPATRLRRSWFLRRCFWQGASRSVLDARRGTVPLLETAATPTRRTVFERLCMAVEKIGMVYGLAHVRTRPT